MREPPYGDICDLLKKGEIIPFLGAGASLGSRATKAVWDEKSADFLPSGLELAHWLADKSSYPSSEDPRDRDDLAKVASYYTESSGRTLLLSRLRNVFDRNFPFGQVHSFLARLPAPLLIVTTNYDDLIEKAFTRRSKPFHLVVHPTDRKDLVERVLWWKPGEKEPLDYPPNRLPLSVRDVTRDITIIYKMHGSIDRRNKKWDSFVITEEDYVEFLARMTGQSAIPKHFMLHFRERQFLFLGYGLRDWNLRVMLKSLKTGIANIKSTTTIKRPNVNEPENDLRSWAIQYKPSELEKVLWAARKVNIYDIEVDVFIKKIQEQMNKT